MPNKVLTVVVPSNPVEVVKLQIPGSQGPPGDQGIPGPSTVLSIGSITTGAEGTMASATITGVSPTQTLHLTIPRGNTGLTGAPANLTIGTITTGLPNAPGAASITGTAPDFVLNLTLPRGYGVPTFGTAGQVLTKLSSTDYDTGWVSTDTASTANTLVKRDSNAQTTSNRFLITAATTVLDNEAARKDYVDGRINEATPNNVGNTVVKRYPDGAVSFNAVYVSTAPTGDSQLTRKDYVDAVGTSSIVANTIVRRNSGGGSEFQAVSIGDATPFGPSAATRKDYVDAQAETRTRRYLIPANYPGASGRQYIRLATIDGINSSGGADLEMILSGQGDIGSAARGTYMVSFTQRGDNITSVKAWAWGHDASFNKLNLYTKQISTYVFELWGQFSPYNNDQYLHVLSGSGYTIRIDSNTTTAPTGLSSAYTIYDWDTELTPVRTAVVGASANTLSKRDTNGDVAFRQIELSGAAPTLSTHAARKDYVDSADSTHAALTVAHGATGAVVGTTNAQTLTSKTLTKPVMSAGGLTLVTGAPNTPAASSLGVYQELDILKTINSSAVARSLGQHWGTVSSYPTTGVSPGDTVILTGSGPSLMRFNGTSWRQVEPCEVANAAARNSISLGVHAGFKVYESDTGRFYQWLTSYGGIWEYVGGGSAPRVAIPYASGWQDYSSGSGGFEGLAYVRSNGMIFLGGLIQNINAIGNGTSYQFIAPGGLPASARPQKQVLAMAIQGNGNGSRIDINTDGSATIIPAVNANALFYFGLNMQWAAA